MKINLSNSNEIIKYVVVGVTTLVLDYILYLLILTISESYILAENLKIPIVLSYNYFMHRIFTFKSKAQKKKQITKYIVSNIIIWIIANVLLISLVYLLKDEINSKRIQIIIMPIVTFFIFKFKVFNN